MKKGLSIVLQCIQTKFTRLLNDFMGPMCFLLQVKHKDCTILYIILTDQK
uniref:Uncharacterized protein n=1 Tax=Anguilla anguilla TaxID=7936 RepID=A0A0E9SCH3_ANGAN